MEESSDQFGNSCIAVSKQGRRKFTVFWQKMTSEEIRHMGLSVSHAM